jgi:hypothetical protein
MCVLFSFFSGAQIESRATRKKSVYLHVGKIHYLLVNWLLEFGRGVDHVTTDVN